MAYKKHQDQNNRRQAYLTLTEIKEKLPGSFLRINKSSIINTDKINKVEGNEIFLLKSAGGFTIGSIYKEAFSLHMNHHLIKTKRWH